MLIETSAAVIESCKSWHMKSFRNTRAIPQGMFPGKACAQMTRFVLLRTVLRMCFSDVTGWYLRNGKEQVELTATCTLNYGW